MPLDTSKILLKLERAQSLIDSAKAELDTFSAAHPEMIAVQKGFIFDPTRYSIVVTKHVEIPAIIGIIAGETIQQIRSSLDHLIHRYIEFTGKIPNRKLQFPAALERNHFKRVMIKEKHFNGANLSALKSILKIQPYRQENARRSTLYWLSQYANIDKHRSILATGVTSIFPTRVQVGTSEQEGPTPGIIGIYPTPPAPKFLPLNSPVEVFAIALEQPVPDFFVETDVKFRVGLEPISGSDPVDMLDTLGKMLALAHQAVGEFEQI
jgi:hypothetical protein